MVVFNADDLLDNICPCPPPSQSNVPKCDGGDGVRIQVVFNKQGSFQFYSPMFTRMVLQNVVIWV